MENNEEIADKFRKVCQLLDGPDKIDSLNEPHKNKYTVVELLKELKYQLENIPEDKSDDKVLQRRAVVHLNLGILHADTEELKAGEEQFMKCIKLLEGKELQPLFILPVISALNQLGIVWSQWNEPLKAQIHLERAEKLYKDYTDPTEQKEDPVNMNDFHVCDTEKINPRELLDKLHTLTLYYLAQVYGSLKNHAKSAVYCHMTLRRQLGETEIAPDLNYIDWALNAATLSQYFMENGENFGHARHHLAAATHVLHKYEDILKKREENEGESEALTADWENYRHRSADVARCWAKYGILLLSTSKQRLLRQSEKDDKGESKKSSDNEETEKFPEDLKFELIERDLATIAREMPDKYLLDFNDARPVFLQTLSWLEDAKKYYSLENHASDHVSVAQDMSQAFKYLSFFEENEERQAKMHKRRVDILEGVIKELNPQYYENACREIWFELGETYSDILDIKLDRLRGTEEKPTPQQLSKINYLTKSAMNNFQSFVNSVKGRDSMNLTEDVLQPTLSAYFHIGRLYNKFITLDKNMQLENTQNSLNAYKYIVEYCGKCQKAAEVMKTELNICTELVALLSIKVDRQKQELMTS